MPLLLSILAGAMNFAAAQNVDLFIKESVVRHIKRDLKKTKNLVIRLNKKEYLKKACTHEKELLVFPIFWMDGEKENLDMNEVSDSCFFNKLRFYSWAGQDVTVRNGKRLDLQDMRFEGLVYDTCLNLMVKYSENKRFYHPSVPAEGLFRAIIEYAIKNVFYVVNFDRHSPYFLVNGEGRVLVFYDVWEDRMRYGFRVVGLEEYLEKIHDTTPFPMLE